VGGFAAGLAVVIALMALRWVYMDDTERTLLDVFGLRHEWRDRVARSRLESAHSTGEADRPLPIPDPAARPIPLAQEATIPILCTCGKVLKARLEFAGKTGRCPACHAPIRIPKE
jgi:hypothetical protein